MNEELNRAIECLSSKITVNITADEALKYTQAASNLATTKERLILCEQLERKSAGE